MKQKPVTKIRNNVFLFNQRPCAKIQALLRKTFSTQNHHLVWFCTKPFNYNAMHIFLCRAVSQMLAIRLYSISQLVHVLWLVNLVGCILLYDLLKFKLIFVAKLFCDLLPSVLNFYNKLKFKTFFYSKLCVKVC